MTNQTYGILQVIPCHDQDVRAVFPYPNGGVLTASRDTTSKLYLPPDPNNTHSELELKTQFRGPTEFVASICCGKTVEGKYEIYCGSNDHNIYVYSPDNPKPIGMLKRHSDTVSSLAFRVCNDKDVLVSGGWDSTAVIWRNKVAECSLYGHVHAIWSIAFVAKSFILTAGADKTIRKWDVESGEILHVFEGHTDCVRGLAVITGANFLSCSNDSSIILWHINGEILKTFEGHKHFVYDLAIIREPLVTSSSNAPSKEAGTSAASASPSSAASTSTSAVVKQQEPPRNRKFKFVSVSEDKSVKIWDKEIGCLQTIDLQATTLWSVAGLDNANFVVGTSDGHAYVFSQRNHL